MQQVYDELFPYYAEVCALTQLRKRGVTPGGWGGHATLFLHGAELDASADHPRLRLGSEGSSGVGISVNRIFADANWVGIPSRDMFFDGGLARADMLDEERFEHAVRVAAASGWFAGIGIRESLARERPAAMPPAEFIARHSIGTDFALTFGRSAYSARLPLPRDRLAKVVDFLNEANERAQRDGYTWNAYTNNCSHVVHNALAAAGVWDAKAARGPATIDVARDVASATRALVTGRMTDFSFPANTYVRLYEAGNRRPIDDAVAAAADHDLSRTIPEGWASTGPGALVAASPMHEASLNRVYEAGRDPFLFSIPLLWDKKTEFEALTRHPPESAVDLDLNLSEYRERYAAALARRSGPLPASVAAFAERFHDVVAHELARTEELLARHRAASRVVSA